MFHRTGCDLTIITGTNVASMCIERMQNLARRLTEKIRVLSDGLTGGWKTCNSRISCAECKKREERLSLKK
ncbi:hypothetical protein OJAV_G00055300 [Oryzias javanicus]|uniref:Uncharacterized protein n=1 Tax=Oryzias javanicus TaxID=123683 RepID=A0A437DA05_ORYJA|nr:hypothetical protein OJAV_G00055300 [Oryzias javanicus]